MDIIVWGITIGLGYMLVQSLIQEKSGKTINFISIHFTLLLGLSIYYLLEKRIFVSKISFLEDKKEVEVVYSKWFKSYCIKAPQTEVRFKLKDRLTDRGAGGFKILIHHNKTKLYILENVGALYYNDYWSSKYLFIICSYIRSHTNVQLDISSAAEKELLVGTDFFNDLSDDYFSINNTRKITERYNLYKK